MTDTTAVDLSAVVDAYFAAFNETDAARRAELIPQAWAEDCAYVDPLVSATGADEINAMIGGLQGQFPGHAVTLSSGLDAHHNLVRFGWDLTDPDGAVVMQGLDVGIVAEDGRLSRIGGFFGPLPEQS
jgi:SnoaL-like domain